MFKRRTMPSNRSWQRKQHKGAAGLYIARLKRTLVPLGVTLLLLLIRLLSILKRLLLVIVIKIIYRPGRYVLKLIFYKIVVKAYCVYRPLAKRIGLSGSDSGTASVLGQRIFHILIVTVALLVSLTNLSTDTKAAYNENGRKTILRSLITSEFGTGEEEQLIIEFFDQEGTISPTQQTYLNELSGLKEQPHILTEADSGADADAIAPMTQGGAAIVKPDIAATEKTEQPRTEIIYYIVEGGDTVSSIAERFGISVNTILWENNLSAYSIIRPGDKLAILPKSGITHEVKSGETISSIAKKYATEEETIIAANDIADASKLKIGQKLVIPGGSRQTYASYTPTTYTGIAAIKDLVKPTGSNPVSGNKMNWPTSGHRITQYYSWRHYGLDIADKIGTPIYAADTGTIEYMGWGKGYGNQIVIDHGGGKKTRYAHLSKFYVEKGQKVSKGETIAAMGSTGWSTGSHLHFEVIINGKKYNPLNYIK